MRPNRHRPHSSRTSFSTGHRPHHTYAVPDHLATKIGVGKRVEVPFGKGGKATAGFCVRVTDVQPTTAFEIKTITRILDDDAIVDDHVMKLTRWMADYYLCGWGQVLHAVVPAGVRDNAGTRVASFVEPLPKDKRRTTRASHWRRTTSTRSSRNSNSFTASSTATRRTSVWRG